MNLFLNYFEVVLLSINPLFYCIAKVYKIIELCKHLLKIIETLTYFNSRCLAG